MAVAPKRLSENPLFSGLAADLAESVSTPEMTRGPARRTLTDIVSGKLGQRMMTGWRLMAKSCGHCNTPLVSKDDVTECVHCESDGTHGMDREDEGDELEVDEGALLEELRRLDEARRAKREDNTASSAGLGEFQVSAAPASRMEAAKQEKQEKQGQDASEKMAELLLKGWCMLNLHCPGEECVTPLMRDKTGKMVCVSCGASVITEEEAKAQNISAVPVVVGDAGRAAETESGAGAEFSARSPAPTAARPGGPGVQANSPFIPPRRAQGPMQAQVPAAEPDASDFASRARTLSRLEEAILFQLSVAAKVLSTPPRGDHFSQVSTACATSRDLLDTLFKLHTTRKLLDQD